jgi:hypothetical protein
MTTLYITHADCRLHDMGPGHPESPARLAAIDTQLRESGLLAQLRCLEAPRASHADLERVHHGAYVGQIFRQAPTAGYRQLDPDTAMNPQQPGCRPARGGRRNARGRRDPGGARAERVLRGQALRPPRHAGPLHGLSASSTTLPWRLPMRSRGRASSGSR